MNGIELFKEYFRFEITKITNMIKISVLMILSNLTNKNHQLSRIAD